MRWLTYLLFISALALYSCKIDQSHKHGNNDDHEHHDHDGNDHDGHDHSGHDHDGHDHDAEKTAYKIVAVNAGTASNGPITLKEVNDSPAFEDAQLAYGNIKAGDKVAKGKVAFKMNVNNYELGAQTSDAENKGLANSGMGQHIHFIINNQPYMAHYGADFEVDLAPGYYVALSFLSRSYHESVKSIDAFKLIDFVVDEADVRSKKVDLEAAHLFYSRPKGTYKGDDAESVLLDFFLVNTELSATGNSVIATINDVPFRITEWKPYSISGLENGKNTITLELVDANGNMIPSPFNKVTRTITLEK